MRLKHLVERLRRYLNEDPRADTTCVRCDEEYSLSRGDDPSRFCDDCAQKIAEEYLPELITRIDKLEALAVAGRAVDACIASYPDPKTPGGKFQVACQKGRAWAAATKAYREALAALDAEAP
jgi:hypothetical protein